LSHPYEHLTPDLVLDALSVIGLEPDGHLLALNSYENRVWQVGIVDGSPMVAKFYRPDRWTDEAIIEEHRFSAELTDTEIPVVPPWQGADTRTLFSHQGFRFALFPRRGGRAPEPGDLDQLEWIGRFIGRIHLAGQARPFTHRPSLDPATMGWAARDTAINSALLPTDEKQAYAQASRDLLQAIEEDFKRVDAENIRLHGDCHHGNILWTDEGPHFVDLDDCRNGPAIQDLWMLLNGDRNERTLQLRAMLDGYQVFHELEPRELALIEPLRGLRMIHYNGWLARRWKDPAFPAAFPWAETPHYWSQHVQDLRQQLAALADEPPRIW
jgi:Ser/Thr protein kinase RdoA (MazF antagonist)